MIGGMDHNLLVVHTGNTLLKSALLGYTREHEWFYSLVSTLSTPAILDGDSTVSLMTISAGAILLQYALCPKNTFLINIRLYFVCTALCFSKIMPILQFLS